MLQFYFLSVLLNVVAGFVLIYASSNVKKPSVVGGGYSFDDDLSDSLDSAAAPYGDSEGGVGSDKPFSAFLNDKIFRLVLGIVCVFIGLIKLVYTVQNDVAFVGDFVPALAGLSGGSCLLVGYFLSAGISVPDFFESFFVSGKKFVGIFCIVAGVLHFIFPRVLFL